MPGLHRGVWRSLVARSVRDGEAPGSNPGTPMRHSLGDMGGTRWEVDALLTSVIQDD